MDKTQTNFDLKGNNGGTPTTATTATTATSTTATNNRINSCISSKITYCGLVIDAHTGGISADYSRYYNQHISAIITIPPLISGADLKRLTRGFLKPRSHALLFDTSINSYHRVQVNVYEIGVLAGIKFHAHVTRMRQGPDINYQFFVDTIVDASKYMWWLVNDRTRKFEPLCTCLLTSCDVEYLILSSFIHVLSRKRNRYQQVLPPLKKEMEMLKGASGNRKGNVRSGVCGSAMLAKETGIVF